MTDRAHTVLAGLDGIRSDLEAYYKDLHRHPELGLREHRTAKKAADALRDLGYEVTDGIGGTGVIGVLANGEGPIVMARADMDALPVREQTGLPYASLVTVTGDGGAEQPVMHACGHDVHMTCLIGCARLMAQAKDAWHGTFVTLFQPSEENGDGADTVINDGLTSKSYASEAMHHDLANTAPPHTIYTALQLWLRHRRLRVARKPRAQIHVPKRVAPSRLEHCVPQRALASKFALARA
jgi:amidohydrolase